MKSPKVKKELYFTLNLTENEHDCVEYDIREFCRNNDLEVLYYRKLKSGHVPMRRECKIRGNIVAFLKWAKEQHLELKNYPKTFKKLHNLVREKVIGFDCFMTAIREA